MTVENTAPQAMSHEADRRLAQGAATGDRQAQREVANRLLQRVRTTIRYLAGYDADYDDLVSAAMVEILRSMGSFRGNSKLETWADRIAVRTAMRWLKRRRSRGHVVELMADPGEGRHGHTEPRQEQRMVRRRLAQQLQKLTEDRREALVLKLVHGYSVAEIAEMTDSSVNTVRDRLQIGRKQLRMHVLRDPVLKNWGGGLAT